MPVETLPRKIAGGCSVFQTQTGVGLDSRILTKQLHEDQIHFGKLGFKQGWSFKEILHSYRKKFLHVCERIAPEEMVFLALQVTHFIACQSLETFYQPSIQDRILLLHQFVLKPEGMCKLMKKQIQAIVRTVEALHNTSPAENNNSEPGIHLTFMHFVCMH